MHETHHSFVTRLQRIGSVNNMATPTIALHDAGEAKTLKPLLTAAGPCFSIYFPLTQAGANQGSNGSRWKSFFRDVETRAANHGKDFHSLLATFPQWDEATANDPAKPSGIAIFHSAAVSKTILLSEPVVQQIQIGNQFYLRPLLRHIGHEANFLLLALSQNDVRLLQCSRSSSKQLALPPDIAVGFDQYFNLAQPDHVSTNRGASGPSSGSSKGVLGTTSTEREDKAAYVSHFFKQIDRGVNAVARQSNLPLVLAGVDQQLASYRSVNTYPHLSAYDVHGAPNGLKGGEMHARALEALDRQYEQKIDKALHTYEHDAGGRASNRAKDIVRAAHDGRVLTLLVSDSVILPGAFDETTHSVKPPNGDAGSRESDLLNDAVIQTLLHAGQVLVAGNNRMPNGAPLAALLRF